MFLVISATIGAIFSILAFVLAAYAIIQIEAMKRSTHQITYIDPMKQNFSDMDQGIKDSLNKSEDPLETLQ